ncbi:MAG: hypothetical protein K9M36_01685 [Candidatus Pacebacteria bacterium]|nr:hypothetical protein [Candidatus Paceibacterota bacterium]
MIHRDHPEIVVTVLSINEARLKYPQGNDCCILVGLVESPIIFQEYGNIVIFSDQQPEAICATGWKGNVLELLRLSLRPP